VHDRLFLAIIFVQFREPRPTNLSEQLTTTDQVGLLIMTTTSAATALSEPQLLRWNNNRISLVLCLYLPSPLAAVEVVEPRGKDYLATRPAGWNSAAWIRHVGNSSSSLVITNSSDVCISSASAAPHFNTCKTSGRGRLAHTQLLGQFRPCRPSRD
jgi:hypothetical protein